MLIGLPEHKARNRLRDFIIGSLNRASDNIHYVHVGANDGKLYDPVFRIAKQLDWSGLLIEPNPLYFSRLSERHKDRPKLSLVNCGISDAAGEMKLFHLKEDAEPKYPRWAAGCATLDRDRLIETLKIARDVDDADIDETTVQLKRLDILLKEQRVKTTDLLVIDVEGHELNVLNSIDLKKIRPKLLLIESNANETSTDAEIQNLMRKAGYVVHRLGDDLLGYSAEFPAIDIADFIALIGFPELAAP